MRNKKSKSSVESSHVISDIWTLKVNQKVFRLEKIISIIFGQIKVNKKVNTLLNLKILGQIKVNT